MKIMNKEGIMLDYIKEMKDYTEQLVTKQFQQRVSQFAKSYQKIQPDIDNRYRNQIQSTAHQYQSSWGNQFIYIFKRNWQNQFRHPLGVIFNILQAILLGLVSIIMENDSTQDQITYMQNFQGLMAQISMTIGFTSVFASVTLFNFQRPIFIKERLGNTYVTSAYFWGRTLAALPLELTTPLIFLGVSYFFVNLQNSFNSFLLAAIAAQGISWMSNSYGMVLSTLYKDPSVVVNFTPVLLLPLLLASGIFEPLSQVNYFYRIFQSVSMFKYGYQALIQSQFVDGYLYINGKTKSNFTLKSQFNFQESYWLSIGLMFGIGIVLRGLSLGLMWYLTNPKVMKLIDPKEDNMILQPIPMELQIESNSQIKLQVNSVQNQRGNQRENQRLKIDLNQQQNPEQIQEIKI